MHFVFFTKQSKFKLENWVFREKKYIYYILLHSRPCMFPHRRWWYLCPWRSAPPPRLSAAAQTGGRTLRGASTAPAAAAASRCPRAHAGTLSASHSPRSRRRRCHPPSGRWHRTGRRSVRRSCWGSSGPGPPWLVPEHWSAAWPGRSCSWRRRIFRHRKSWARRALSSAWRARPGRPPVALGVRWWSAGPPACWCRFLRGHGPCSSACGTGPGCEVKEYYITILHTLTAHFSLNSSAIKTWQVCSILRFYWTYWSAEHPETWKVTEPTLSLYITFNQRRWFNQYNLGHALLAYVPLHCTAVLLK